MSVPHCCGLIQSPEIVRRYDNCEDLSQVGFLSVDHMLYGMRPKLGCMGDDFASKSVLNCKAEPPH